MADSATLPADLPEATTGFEPVIAVLQTAAFPLGYVAASQTERAMGFEPTTLSLARRCSTTEPRPHDYSDLALSAAAQT
jgi:hypothetical protein